jgi:hypothetical protein
VLNPPSSIPFESGPQETAQRVMVSYRRAPRNIRCGNLVAIQSEPIEIESREMSAELI